MTNERVQLLSTKRGFALVIILAFIVLLTGVVVAYFSRATADQQASVGSSSQVEADQIARSALEVIVADLKQEIVSGTPITSANIQPQRNGTPAPNNAEQIPNLIRRSFQDEATGTAPIPPPGVNSRASRVNSTAPALNGRGVTTARWNSHYLVPRRPPTSGETWNTLYSDPVSSFVAPDWVVVTANGPSVVSPPAVGTIGRYAYAIYDLGGVLDINVAGFPFSPTTPNPGVPGVLQTDVGRKGTVAFADMRAVASAPSLISPASTPSAYLPAAAINDIVGWRNYATVQPSGSFGSFTFDAAGVGSGSRFATHFLDTTNSFLTAATAVRNNRTDQVLVNRAELLRLRSSIGFSQNVLQYLSTFSRGLNRPTWADASTRLANRFPLSRFDLLLDPVKNAGAIKRYFGLVYVPPDTPPGTPEHWEYHGANGTGLQASIHVLTGNGQDPDLSVLLRYAMPGSVPDSEILSIVASLVDQRDGNTETTWIEFAASDPALPPQRAWGVDTSPSTQPGAPPPPGNVTVLNRAFRNVGEIGYAYRNGTTSLDFWTAASVDARLLDLFTFSTAPVRSGLIDLNTRNISAIAALLRGATVDEASSAFVGQNDPASSIGRTATRAASDLINDATHGTRADPALGRHDVSRLAAAVGTTLGTTEEAKEAVARVLAETGQTRTWNLFIDVVAQSGRYPPSAASLADFAIDGEKRYWLHIAIDRFTGEIIDQQLEAVYE